ncbi:MAG: hypothetical protein ACREAA_08590 [Candidatus Polarisedimenticolia bacterium]
MPRILVGRVIELHYASPSDMVAHLGSIDQGTLVPLDPGTALDADSVREVVVHVPWLGHQLHLKGTVVHAAQAAGPPLPRLRLGDGPHDRLDQLAGIIAKVRSGAVLEPDQGEINPEARIRAMSPTLRAMLAPKAGPEERQVLVKDADPRIIEMLLKNPGITVEEVRRLASRLTLTQTHMQQILSHPAWSADEGVRVTLARNPRLPEYLAERLMPTIPVAVLKMLAMSSQSTASTRRVAGRVLTFRTGCK